MTDEERIIALFNRTELRKGETTISNSDSTISNELGLNLSVVTKTITDYLDSKFDVINKRDVFIDKDTVVIDYEVSLRRIEFLELELSKGKNKYDALLKKHQRVNRDSDRLKVLNEMIIEKFSTPEIVSALGYRSTTNLYDFVKRAKKMKYSEYKKQLLNE